MKLKYIDLGLFAKKKKCILERDNQRNSEIVNMKSLKKTIQKELKNIGTSVIIDGHYSHELLNDSEVDYVFVLRKAPWELQKVLKLRKYAKKKILENIEAEILGIIMQEAKEKFIKEKLFEIDGTQKTSERIALEIQDIIDGKTTNSHSIDWMTCKKTLLLLERNSCS
jgi:adenylate kinase